MSCKADSPAATVDMVGGVRLGHASCRYAVGSDSDTWPDPVFSSSCRLTAVSSRASNRPAFWSATLAVPAMLKQTRSIGCGRRRSCHPHQLCDQRGNRQILDAVGIQVELPTKDRA